MRVINPNSKQAQGLIGAWNFEDGDVRDLVGRHANGTATEYTKEGIKQPAMIPQLQLAGIQTLTISCWLMVEPPNGNIHIFMEDSINANATFNGSFWIGAYYNVQTGVYSTTLFSSTLYGGTISSPYYDSINFPAPTVGLHHLTFVYDRRLSTTQTVAIYVDGVAQPLTKVTGLPNIPAGTNFSTQDFYLLARGGTSYPSNFSISELRFYSLLLNSSEVNELYSNPNNLYLAPKPQQYFFAKSPIAKFRFDQNLNLSSTGSNVVGSGVKLLPNGDIQASAFNSLANTCRINADGSITANSFKPCELM